MEFFDKAFGITLRWWLGVTKIYIQDSIFAREFARFQARVNL